MIKLIKLIFVNTELSWWNLTIVSKCLSLYSVENGYVNQDFCCLHYSLSHRETTTKLQEEIIAMRNDNGKQRKTNYFLTNCNLIFYWRKTILWSFSKIINLTGIVYFLKLRSFNESKNLLNAMAIYVIITMNYFSICALS